MTRYSLVVLKVPLNTNQTNKQTMCIYSLTDYMLLVSVIETFIVTVPLYICIFISLWLLMAAACVGGYEWRMKKNDCQPVIYACRTTVYHLLI